jgi:hypothetical protein
MKTEHDDAYLWDRSGEPDPEVVHLEEVLGRLRHRGMVPALPPRAEASQFALFRRIVLPLAVAAGLIIAVGATWIVVSFRTASWSIEHVSGTPQVNGRVVRDEGRLDVGEWLVTDAASRARVAAGHIGRVDVDPDTRVQLVTARGNEHRLALERGTIHARIWAPPKFFYVNTPAATAIDLGCAYTLHVDDSGAGLLRVTHGWVGFERDGREAYIPQGAVCRTRPGIGPGTPYYEDAPSGYGEALAVLDFGSAGDVDRAAALDRILSHARRRDALTLWHLLTRGTPAERAQVYERLSALAPPPPRATRDLVLAGDRTALSAWWDSLEVETGTWWRLLKKKW